MSTVIHHFCDRCKTEIGCGLEGASRMFDIRFALSLRTDEPINPAYSSWKAEISERWCFVCVESLGVEIEPWKSDHGASVKASPPLSFGDGLVEMIREIIREEVSNATS